MLFITLSFILSYLIEWTLVGVFAFVLLGDKIRAVNYKKGILMLLPFIAINDVLLIPGIVELDLSVVIGNQSIRDLFDLHDGNIPVNDLVGIGWYDVGTWMLGSAIGYFTGHIFYDQAFIKKVVA